MLRPLFTLLCLLWPALVAAAGASADGPRALRTDATGTRFAPGGGPLDLAPDGTLHVLRVETTMATFGRTTVYFHTCLYERRPPAGETKREVLARWNTLQPAPNSLLPHAARFTADGRFLAVATWRGSLWLFEDNRPKRRLTERLVLPVAEARLVLDARDEPHVFVRRALSYAIERVAGLDAMQTVLEGTDYDWAVARDAAGFVYVSAYDYAERNLVVAAADEKSFQWQRMDVDSRESGWQHTVAAAGEQVLVLSYYFRNAFNRGLNLVTLEKGTLLERHTFLRLRDENGGWAPTLALRPDGRVVVSHRLREQAEEQSTEMFESVAAFRARRAEELTGAWEDDYRAWSVSAAVLPRWRFWSVQSPTPSKATTPGRFDAEYAYDPALELGAMLEGRIGDWDLGFVYLQGLVSDAISDKAGEAAGHGFQVLSGWIGVDQLLFGHDFKLSTSWGRYRGEYSDQLSSRETTTDVTEVEARLLNQWRLGYGLSYRGYDLPLPHYVYRAPRGDPDYVFIGSAAAQTEISRWEAFVGYSRIDYLTKYENSFHGFDLEGRLGIGLSVLDWADRTYAGERVGGTVDLALSAQARLGYVLYRRFYALQGAGFFVRGGYEGAWLGSGLDNERPEPRDPSDEDIRGKAVAVLAAHHQLFHGPYLSLGLVY